MPKTSRPTRLDSRRCSIGIAVILLIVMLGLMLGPARQDSATVDETTVLAAGYSFWNGHRFYFMPEHPPLSPMLVNLPVMLSMNPKLSPEGRAIMERQAGYPWTVGWYGDVRPLQQVFPDGRNSWYYFALPEAQLFGQVFVYGSGNDGNEMRVARIGGRNLSRSGGAVPP